MGMLYWSSVLIEEGIKNLRFEMSQMRNDLFVLRLDVAKSNRESKNDSGGKGGSESRSETRSHSHMDESLPNLLQPDEFYLATLPKLLGKEFKPHGTFQGATIGRPDNLHPFNNFAEIASWHGLCSGAVGKMAFGRFETFTPDFAVKMEARKVPGSDIIEYWVHLRKDLYWQPLNQNFFGNTITLAPEFLRKQPLTAHDFAFYYDAIINPHVEQAGAIAVRSEYQEIEEIKVIDDYTFIVRWKAHLVEGKPKIPFRAKSFTIGLSPLPQFVYKYFSDGQKIVADDSAPDTYRTSKIWAQNFAEHWAKNIIVSCGPWVFDGMTERSIKFKRNEDFYNPYGALAEGMVVRFKESTEGIWQDFKGNQLDSYNLPPDQLLEWESFAKSSQYAEQSNQNHAIKTLNYVARVYYYIGWNQAKGFFGSQKVRQALTMAIDRKRIIEQNLSGLGLEVTCPFYVHSPSCDPTIEAWPFDPVKARRLLEEEGWSDSDGDGVIDKEIDGKRVPFEFSLTYYVKNNITKSICEYVATALKKIGISCRLHGVDMADLSSAFQEKSFDALCMGWALGSPPEDPRQLWSSAGAHEKGSSNAIGFANAEADKIIEALRYEADPEKRLELYHRFHAIINEEQPYTFLYSPKTQLLYREYLQNVFLPAKRQDLVPGANLAEPDSSIFWLKN